MEASVHDVVMIGGGAAGLGAALTFGRARRRVVVVDAGAPRNAPAAHMHGYLSRDGMPPGELLAAGRREVTGYGGGSVGGPGPARRPGWRGGGAGRARPAGWFARAGGGAGFWGGGGGGGGIRGRPLWGAPGRGDELR